MDYWIAKPLVLIGNASYSLYLVHWVILINFWRVRYRAMVGVTEEFAEVWRNSFFGLSIFLAIAIYFLFEKFLAKAANKLSKK